MVAARVILCFFFQAEDGIRDYKVTGVQTCALPIFLAHADTTEIGPTKGRFRQKLTQLGATDDQKAQVKAILRQHQPTAGPLIKQRSEERRVGKECRSRWSPYH